MFRFSLGFMSRFYFPACFLVQIGAQRAVFLDTRIILSEYFYLECFAVVAGLCLMDLEENTCVVVV